MRPSTLSTTLLISDDDRRARRLASNLGSSGHTHIYDLDDDQPCIDLVNLIIIDMVDLSSTVFARLISILGEIRRGGVPLLFLAHGNPAQAQSQAEMIGATKTVPAAMALQSLCATAAMMRSQIVALPTSTAVKLATEARQFLVEVFFSGASVTPELATVGSDLIAEAVSESGIRNWVSAVQQFDNVTHQHCLLVAGLGAAFATGLGLGRIEGFRLTKAALLHDVGKTQIPIAILNKPGPLTADEMALMRTHAVEGYEMLKDSEFSDETLRVVRSHHELLNGSGYPDGLQEDEIPDLVRLVTICDIFGALVERRSYKPPLPASQAYSIIMGMTERLDMDLVAAFQPVTEAMA